jgi:hypothetical protein
MFESIAEIEPSLSNWFLVAKSRQQALKSRIDTDPETLTKLFIESVQRRDDNGAVIDELGFRLTVWNGLDYPDATNVSITCGVRSPWVKNVCLLTLPSSREILKRILQPDTALRLSQTVAASWKPQWLTLSSSRLEELLSTIDYDIRPGWLIYLADRSPDELRGIDESVTIHPASGGVFLLAAKHQFSSDDASQIRAISKVIQYLSDRHMLDVGKIFPDKKMAS